MSGGILSLQSVLFPVLQTHSPYALQIKQLFNQILILSLIGFLIISFLIFRALIKYGKKGLKENNNDNIMMASRKHYKEIYWLIIPGLVVIWLSFSLINLVLTINVHHSYYSNNDNEESTVDIEATGQRWFWNFYYPKTKIWTANEVHIPIGKKLKVLVQSKDVIHSFWVPQLAPKIDAIPGRKNYLWLQADKPGKYIGMCSEFCGVQHAHMNFYVIAHKPEDYDRWLQQNKLENLKLSKAEEKGKHLLQSKTCLSCHRLRGLQQQAGSGPDLTNLHSRQFMAGGVLSVSPKNVKKWLLDPDAIKPGTLMPNFQLSQQEASDLTAYLMRAH